MLEVKPAHPGKSDIEHQATGPIPAPVAQEVLRGGERLGMQSDGFRHTLDGVTHRDIIIDYKDRGLIFNHPDSASSSTGSVNRKTAPWGWLGEAQSRPPWDSPM